jgi:lambda family phage portal protein
MPDAVPFDPHRGSRVLAAFRAEQDARRQAQAAVRTSAPAPKAVRMRRSFAGAAVNRLTSSFPGEHVSLNEDLERSLRILRSRSRHLAKNNDYVRKFLRMVQTHVVGPQGFALSVPAQRPDGSIDDADKRVCEQAFARWARRGVCELSTRLSFNQFMRLWILHVARDGEALVRRVRDRRINDFGYALQLIDPVLLDETYRADLPGGVRIRMGVEVDANGRPLAYHFLRSAEYGALGGQRTRVPAEDIWHCFVQEEVNQVRGVPWVHTAMRRLNDLGGYEEAAVIAARVGASNMGFFVPPVDLAGPGINGTVGTDSLDDDGGGNQVRVREAEPGAFDELPPGYDFKSFDPDYPHAQFGTFVKACLRGIAAGIGVDYNTLANDLEGVNYSSIRSGTL